MISNVLVFKTTHVRIEEPRFFTDPRPFYVATLVINGANVRMSFNIFGAKPFTEADIVGEKMEFDLPLEASGDIHGVKSICIEKTVAVDDPEKQWNTLRIETDKGEVRFCLYPKNVRQDDAVLY
jgi:hypothetical protein